MDRSLSFGRMTRRMKDVTTISYDRRGYGSSTVEACMLSDHLDDLICIIEPLQQEVILFGHSAGGVVALRAAQQRPELVVGVLIFETPAMWFDFYPRNNIESLAETPEERAEVFMKQMIGERTWRRLGTKTHQKRRAEGIGLDNDSNMLNNQYQQVDLGEIHVPVWVCASADAPEVMHTGALRLAEAIPHGTFKEIVNTDHGIHLTNPAAAAELVTEFRRYLLGDRFGTITQP